MDTLLSHTTALELLRSFSLRRRVTRGARSGQEPPEHPPSADDVEAITGRFPELTLPLHVSVSDKNRRGPTGLVAAHVTEVPLPHDSTIVLAEGIRCVSPEHLAVQMATQLSLLELVFLLGEILGLYAICPSREEGMFKRSRPLTTKRDILDHLDALGPTHGTRLVRHALALACERSATPLETKLTMRLCLKPSLGGYHLNVLSVTDPLEVVRLGKGLRRGVRRPDVMLGSRKGPAPYSGVSFDFSDDDRQAPTGADRGTRRQSDLLAINFKSYVLTKALYDDIEYMDDVVARARADLGLPKQRLTKFESARRRRLGLTLYGELEAMDGITWHGRGRGRLGNETLATHSDHVTELAPVDAHALDQPCP